VGRPAARCRAGRGKGSPVDVLWLQVHSTDESTDQSCAMSHGVDPLLQDSSSYTHLLGALVHHRPRIGYSIMSSWPRTCFGQTPSTLHPTIASLISPTNGTKALATRVGCARGGVAISRNLIAPLSRALSSAMASARPGGGGGRLSVRDGAIYKA